jgi:hypothetical protein
LRAARAANAAAVEMKSTTRVKEEIQNIRTDGGFDETRPVSVVWRVGLSRDAAAPFAGVW